MNLFSTVLAQKLDLTPGAEATGASGLETIEFESLITWVVTAIIVVAGLVFFFMLVLGGLKWIMSGGDKAATEGARSQITAALIGLVIIFSAWAIVNLITAIFNVNILDFSIPAIMGG